MKTKTFLLGGFVLLFMIGFMKMAQNHNSQKETLCKIAGAACGPCMTIPFDKCGYDGGMGTCVWNGEWCGTTEAGICGIDCPGTDNHQGCADLVGSCTMGTVNCDQRIRPNCIYQAVPAGCRCENDTGTLLGTFCQRADC